MKSQGTHNAIILSTTTGLLIAKHNQYCFDSQSKLFVAFYSISE